MLQFRTMKNQKTILGLVQMSMTDSAELNMKKALQLIAEAAKKGADIVVLPELFLGEYFCQKKDDKSAFEQTEAIPGPSTKILSDAAKKHNIVLIGGSIFEKGNDGKFYNTAPVFERDGTLLGTYRKTHIPEDILYHEQHYFAPGDTGIKVFKTSAGKIAPLICYDQWYPEAARIAALKGAELIVYPTAIGVIDDEVEENITGDWETMWRSVQVGHAGANNVYIAGINRIGKEDAITFWGGSFVADPSAKVLVKADNKEGVFLAECDFSRVVPMQKAWRFLENRRPEAYELLTEKP
jgi:predicted amidohydrolase